MALDKYRGKRDFSQTPEPSGDEEMTQAQLFVIQKHDATRLHYDLRLAAGGVLLSWAVPKGPSLDPSTKRLAMRTEDHPMSYADFEGNIPEGNYGAGSVIVWDAGSYEHTTTHKGAVITIEEALKNGHVTFELNGEKLQGEWALTRTDERKWLLVKKRDDRASDIDITRQRPESILTGRTNEEVAASA